MTPLAADKTSIPSQVSRRHTDPPSLWIAVTIGSVSLHLLAFWLLRSYHLSQLFQQQSKTAIPIEFVEVYQKKKSTAKAIARIKSVAAQAKPVTPKPPATTDKLQTANSPKPVVSQEKSTTKPSVTTADENKIAMSTTGYAYAQQRQREIQQQRQRQLAEQRQREIQQQQQRQLAEQQQRQLAEQRQREIQQQQQRQLAELRQRELQQQQQRQLAEQQQRQLAEQQQREIQQQQQRQLAEQQQRQRELAEQQSQLAQKQPPENPDNTNSSQLGDSPGGSLIANLVGEPQQGQKDRHTNPAKIKPSNQPFSKGLEYTKFIEQKPGEPVELTVILTISEKGKLESLLIADNSISPKQKSEYEDFLLNQVFNGWEFEPAYDIDPNDPKPSNLTVRIRIQPLS